STTPTTSRRDRTARRDEVDFERQHDLCATNGAVAVDRQRAQPGWRIGPDRTGFEMRGLGERHVVAERRRDLHGMIAIWRIHRGTRRATRHLLRTQVIGLHEPPGAVVFWMRLRAC